MGIIHSETTTGLLNPAQEIGKAIYSYDPSITYIVDAMSSFGAVHLDLYESNISYLVSSSNKMLQGVPGFAFVIGKIEEL